MLIDEKITLKIASLAKLELTEQEIKEYSKDLTNILKWMEELKEVDVSNVQPVTSVTKNELYEREDIAYKNTVEQEKILLNAPEKVGEYFTVPKVIE
ncbi:MAG: aspartyl/glutamyl-tRNA(Asn/Gln) amidotransferase subunit C [Alphaproteobacteria bacterium]|jgi:aspartyl-tRNA(Asn)/glutamyl-tRNA(Gln) amidotransferase subunit C|nr:MAG: aspartyl/glutamyl-tRNA(Asn/Gln) amidotransferase subunit C [Alphaproteobacteria bacterium]|tara:strand:+ start:530 stop:820 length:291 start_codon:yes stop_codon:yes gene_type:complete